MYGGNRIEDRNTDPSENPRYSRIDSVWAKASLLFLLFFFFFSSLSYCVRVVYAAAGANVRDLAGVLIEVPL